MIRIVDLEFGDCRRRIWGFFNLLDWKLDEIVRFVLFKKI